MKDYSGYLKFVLYVVFIFLLLLILLISISNFSCETRFSLFTQLLVGIATVLLALVAIFSLEEARKQGQLTLQSLQHTKEQEILEHKRLLMTDILKDVAYLNAFALANRSEAISTFVGEDYEKYVNNHRDKYLFEQFEPIRSKIVYIEEISKIISPEFNAQIIDLKEALKKQLEDLHEIKRDIRSFGNWKDTANRIASNNSIIHNNAVTIIKNIAQLETQDL